MSSAVILNAAHFIPNSADYGQERIMIKRIAATLLIAAFGLSSTACIGRFATSGLVRKFNLTVVQDKWPHEIVFLLLYIIPVYPLAGMIDDFEIRAADGSPHFVNVVREEGQLVARDADGQRIALVDSMTGEVRDIDQTGNL